MICQMASHRNIITNQIITDGLFKEKRKEEKAGWVVFLCGAAGGGSVCLCHVYLPAHCRHGSSEPTGRSCSARDWITDPHAWKIECIKQQPHFQA